MFLITNGYKKNEEKEKPFFDAILLFFCDTTFHFPLIINFCM
jgi:hypothetical protein